MAQNLLQLLKEAAASETCNGLTIHQPNTEDTAVLKITYTQLYEQANRRAKRLEATTSLSKNPIILLHVEDHFDAIPWFWAIIAAGAVPCMSTQFSRDPEQRQRHIRSLQKLLHRPLIVTTEALLANFPCKDEFLILTTSAIDNISSLDIDSVAESARDNLPGLSKQPEELALLLLTSGSTGESKAVSLTHFQILAAVDGKIKLHGTSSRDTFLAWTSFDHAANLVEIHLHSLRLEANQIHISPLSVIEDPLEFLYKLSTYHVSYTFAPNFLLAKICSCLDFRAAPGDLLPIDLNHLRALISGGESNTTGTAVKLTTLLQRYNAPKSFIRPGLGLTETCAGAVYSLDCPSYDLLQGLDHCSVGCPTDAIQIRIMHQNRTEAAPGEIGLLQLSGPGVFKEYFNSPEKTAGSFTHDGWFKTGDLAWIDKNGKLLLTGREKDIVIVNGVNHYTQKIENDIEAAQIAGVVPSYTVAFSHRPKGHDTEALCIVYLPNYDSDDYSARNATGAAISKRIILSCGVRPYIIIPLPASFLQKSSLGKLSRQHIRDGFEKGNYAAYICATGAPSQGQKVVDQEDTTPTERIIIDICLHIFPNSSMLVSRESDLFALGMSSIDILKLQSALQKALRIPNIPHGTIFAHPIVHELATALEQSKSNHTFSPIVLLQAHGDKKPLWLIHSGLGEILIFMSLARHITDRPVYAIRARGFDGEPHFTSLNELITTYHEAIKMRQPEGPYAIAGYAYGAVPAFEITKRMESHGDEVKFLGVFDQQPFSKDRVRMYDWYRVVLLLASFVGLIKEDYAISYLAEARNQSHEEVLDHIMSLAPLARLEELGMNKDNLDNWAHIAHGMKKSVSEYDPEGTVKCMDVFYAVPMPGYGPADTVENWFDGYISKWDAFVEGGAEYHLVEGSHKTMINSPYVEVFQERLNMILEERGL